MNQVEIIYRQNSTTHHKFMPWRKPATNQHLQEWAEDYIDRLREGYRPEGFEQPPIPHCMRVIQRGRVVAEWHLSPGFSSESLVTAEQRPGSEGIPTNTPSAPCSELLRLPKTPDPRGHVPIQSESSAMRTLQPDLNKAVLTTG